MWGECEFNTWFEALQYMEDEIKKVSFDIALVGCGSYGFPLAAYIKKNLNKSVFHCGGCLQMMFGIKGSRWENSPIYKPFLMNTGYILWKKKHLRMLML